MLTLCHFWKKEWSCAVSRFKMHSKSDIHKTSMATMQSFLNVKQNKIKSIETIQNKIIDDKITQNRMKLAFLIKIALLLARRNVPFRGHRDDSKYYDKENSGNFQALIYFRIDSGDTVLKEHFDTTPKNATYRSKTIQNEIISCAAEVMNNKIIAEIKKSKFFSILSDEVTDCSNKEQMPLVIRYVDCSNIIQVRFIKFIHCNEGVSGEALKDKIIDCLLNELNLDVENCRGQCYDGAGNMAGKYSGVAACILNLNPLALFTHCASHRLNLCIAAALKTRMSLT